jgi:hypothetical protein
MIGGLYQMRQQKAICKGLSNEDILKKVIDDNKKSLETGNYVNDNSPKYIEYKLNNGKVIGYEPLYTKEDLERQLKVWGNELDRITITATIKTTGEEVIFKIENNDKFYSILPTSPLFNTLKRISIYTANDRELPSQHGKLKTNMFLNGTLEANYNSPTMNFKTIQEDFKKIGKKANANYRKTLNFLLINSNQQNYNKDINFTLKDYQEKMGYKDLNTAYMNF